MPTLTIALDGRELQRLTLTQPRTTVGRRPYNDIVMEHLAVSGEHAVFVLQPDGRVQVLDLNSTNGTYVNGRAVVSADVGPDDLVEIARYQLRVLTNGTEPHAAPEPADAPEPPVPQTPPSAPPASAAPPLKAHLKLLNGPTPGREMPLVKVTTTLGKPGRAVVAITQHDGGHSIALVEGDTPPTVNGQPVDRNPLPLNTGDRIVVAGAEMQYLHD